jgi:mono/diheme cytochrome c family protein
MRSFVRAGLGALGGLCVLAAAGAGFVWSGLYDIGADDHHGAMTLALITELRERSIARRARALRAPDLDDPRLIAAGANLYARLCVSCHLAPGVARSDVRAGLYPHPPNLAQEEPSDVRRTFWTIKHGIKMSAMPAWGKSLGDAAIWQLAAFVRTLPTLSEESYRRLAPQGLAQPPPGGPGTPPGH